MRFAVNTQFLLFLLLTLSCGGFQMGHVIACMNQLSSTFSAKFPQYAAHPTLFSSLIGSSGIFGTTLGALSGGRIIKMGRKKTFIMANLIGFLGLSIQMIEKIPAILIGRLIYGVGCGLMSIVGPRFVEETVPDHLLPVY